MSDTKWGFEKEYSHRQLPNAWQSSSGFSLFTPDSLRKETFRNTSLPVYRECFPPSTTSYVERSQDDQLCMSLYGAHRELPWTDSLRSPRNPFPGKKGHETRYKGEPWPYLPCAADSPEAELWRRHRNAVVPATPRRQRHLRPLDEALQDDLLGTEGTTLQQLPLTPAHRRASPQTTPREDKRHWR
mmetsp:Transcript_92958/g.207644  ORF Transcript_92958/g.207644 Transcript_92958/m.207644 type:complete len:186 (+) Transcript_92958:60-617(+)